MVDQRLSSVLTSVALCMLVSWATPRCGAAQEKAREPETHTFAKEISKKVRLDYLVYLPPEYAQSEKSWPLLLWLHGDGGQPDKGGLAEIRSYGPPDLAEKGRSFPFILIAPQLWGDVHWDPDTLSALLQEIMRTYRVDQDRVYLMGYSRGGFGAWEFGCSYSEIFAAVVVISGRPMTSIERLRHCAVWIFHGELDDGVPVYGARDMFKVLKSVGADVRLTIYPEVGHSACDLAMETQELWEWLLEQKRKHPAPMRGK